MYTILCIMRQKDSIMIWQHTGLYTSVNAAIEALGGNTVFVQSFKDKLWIKDIDLGINVNRAVLLQSKPDWSDRPVIGADKIYAICKVDNADKHKAYPIITLTHKIKPEVKS